MKKNILIISFSYLHRDPRILRQIYALYGTYNIQTVGYTSPSVEGIDFFEAIFVKCKNLFEKIGRALSILSHQYNVALERRYSFRKLLSYDYKVPDAIFSNDYDGLYAAFRLKKEKEWGCKIYFDAHEYFPRYRESFYWKAFERPLVHYVFKEAMREVSIMSAVCPTAARMYEDYFGFTQGTVRLITNAPAYEPELEPHPVGDKIRMVHHGAAIKVRQLEKMIDMMKYLPKEKYELHFMLVHNEEKYYQRLVRRAEKYPNIHFLDPVPTKQIASFTNQFDIGLFMLNNKIISYKYALPNKFFEFVQARLAIAIGDSPEMRSYIDKYKLGVSARKNTPRAMAEEILSLSKDDIMRFKQNAHAHARKLSAEPNIAELRRIAGEMTS